MTLPVPRQAEGEQTVPNHRIEEPCSEDQIPKPDVSSNFIYEVDFVEEADSTEEDLVEEVDLTKKSSYAEEVEYAEEKETGFNLFEQRQLQYFIGKRVEKDIILDNTEILRAGERITPEIVTHITTRSTLMEVTSHLQKN